MKVGRPTSLTPELSARLVDVVGRGLPLSKAADLVGIGYSTLKGWMRRKEPLYTEFAANLKAAKSTSQIDMIEKIRGGRQGWQGAAWYLERSDPKNWGRKDNLTQTVRKEPANEKMSDAELLAKAKKLIAEAESLEEKRH